MRKLGIALMLTGSLAISSGCGMFVIGDWNFTSHYGTWEDEFSFSGQEVVIEGFNGSITVEVWEESRVEVSVTWSAKVDNYIFSPLIQDDPKQLLIAAPGSDRDLSGTSFVVSVPQGIRLTLITSNGRVSVSGCELSELFISTSNGAAMVETQGTGELNISTSNGLVRVSDWQGNISCTTSNGAITAILNEVTDGEYIFITSNGGISLSTHSDSRFELMANTSNGNIRTSLEGDWLPQFSESDYTGSYNGGGASITARTSNGNIQLLPEN